MVVTQLRYGSRVPLRGLRRHRQPILVYIIGLVTMLALSAAYNMWPVLPAKSGWDLQGSLSAQTRPFFLLLPALLLCRLTSCIPSIARCFLLGSYSCLLFGF